tara:strand:+ start:30554 stop:30736 length:183 start_codon:yes stop_codon:yes gene_type:complete
MATRHDKQHFYAQINKFEELDDGVHHKEPLGFGYSLGHWLWFIVYCLLFIVYCYFLLFRD